MGALIYCKDGREYLAYYEAKIKPGFCPKCGKKLNEEVFNIDPDIKYDSVTGKKIEYQVKRYFCSCGWDTLFLRLGDGWHEASYEDNQGGYFD
jgi:hypothetical protein